MSEKASGDPAREPIGVFVLDDQEIVRRGVRGLVEAEPRRAAGEVTARLLDSSGPPDPLARLAPDSGGP